MKERQLIYQALGLQVRQGRPADLAFLGLFVAFTAIATFIHIPGPYGSYFNLGEVAIYLIALLCGPVSGAIAGALGSSLVDIGLGYSVWAPFTFIIKGVEGYIVGRLGHPPSIPGSVAALALGGLWMIIGYGITTWYLYSWPAVIPEVLIDIAQVFIGAIIALPLAFKIMRAVGKRSKEDGNW